jgi:hypothetical protein
LNRQWLRVAELALKGVGFFVIVILPYALWNQHTMLQEKEKGSDKARQETAMKLVRHQMDSEQRVTDLLHHMIELESNPEGRRQVIAVLRPTLRNPSLSSLALAQAVYTIALTDSDPKVRGEAWDVLFPNTKTPISEDLSLENPLLPRDFVESLRSRLSESPPLVDQIPYKTYVTILIGDQNNIDKQTIDEIKALNEEAKVNENLVKLIKKPSRNDADSKAVEETKNQMMALLSRPSAVGDTKSHQTDIASVRALKRTPERKTLDWQSVSRRPASVIADGSDQFPPSADIPLPQPARDNSQTQPRDERVLRALADKDVATMILALQSLSPEERSALKPHVEVYEVSTSETASESVENARRAIIKAGFIVPKAQTKRAKSPDNPTGVVLPESMPEVRYLKLADNSPIPTTASEILEILKSSGYDKAAIDKYPCKPSDNDRKFYGEGALQNHFEVWFQAATTEVSTPAPAPVNPSPLK